MFKDAITKTKKFMDEHKTLCKIVSCGMAIGASIGFGCLCYKIGVEKGCNDKVSDFTELDNMTPIGIPVGDPEDTTLYIDGYVRSDDPDFKSMLLDRNPDIIYWKDRD